MLKLKNFIMFAAVALGWATASAQTPAFPGAEGYARLTTTGGRGGKVYHVTNLNDSGTGSLRWALAQSGARTIVFDVSGYIDLQSDLIITKGDVTIAGQTAPYPGITIRYYTVQNKADNVIMRFIRIRRSQVKDVNDGADATWGRQQKNIILDHCSFSWSIDETASYYDNRNFTMQWCNIGESLNNAGHGKGAHGYGGIWGGKCASFHHNFLAHHTNRSPRINGSRYNWSGYDKTLYANSVVAERVDLRNCVIYNWGQSNGAYGAMGGYLNIVNNYYKAGPGTKNKTRVFQCSVNASKDSDGALPDGLMGRFYISGNYVTAASKPANYDWSGVKTDGASDFTFTDEGNLYGEGAGATLSIKLTTETDGATLADLTTTHTAEEAYEAVLTYGGASLYRDAVDLRHAEEARTGTTTYTGPTIKVKGMCDTVNDPDKTEDPTLPSFPELESNTRPADYDTDGDGIPDDWEKANGLNPNDAADGATTTIDTRGWYTNLEVYLSSVVESIIKAQNANATDPIDEYFPAYIFTALSRPEMNGEDIVGFEYYTPQGQKIAEPQMGISIRRTIYSGGRSESELVLKK